MQRQLASDAAAEAQRLAAGRLLTCSRSKHRACVPWMHLCACAFEACTQAEHDPARQQCVSILPVSDVPVHCSAEAAEKAAQAEELRIRFEALSAQKAGLVQQLKQVHCTSLVSTESLCSIYAVTGQHAMRSA